MKSKNLGGLVLALLMVATLAFPMGVSGETQFSDVNGHWAEKYVNQAVSQGIIKGYSDGTFRPDNPVTRAEFISMANRTLGCTGSTNISFNDVPYSAWYYSDVAKAVSATYVAGYDDTTFKPDNAISRQEVAVMISRFVPTYGYTGSLKTYSDYGSISDWATTALSKINGKGYIGAYSDGRIHPLDPLTRAQTAKILCEIRDKESISTSDPVVTKDGTKLSGKIYSNNVTIHKDLSDKHMSLDNCVILGSLDVQGGGMNTVTVNNCRVANSSVNRSADRVRVLATGETTVANLTTSNNSILQTSSLSNGSYGLGFAKITLLGSADSILRGSFPKVIMGGSTAKANLESGSITELDVDSSGKRSDITIASGATVSNAIVNGESYFHGTGSISQMAVNVDGVTYETKPKNWTIASRVTTPKQTDAVLSVTFSPASRATKVKLDTNITITFSTAMAKYDGKSISSSDISNFVYLRKDSSSGKSLAFSASIDSAKKVITLDPSSNLDTDSRYYISIDKNVMKDSYDIGNASQSSYFDTGETTEKYATTFTPENKNTSVSVNPNITINFSESVVKYSNGGSLSSSDISDMIYLKSSGSTGPNVSYSVSSISSRKVVITPKSSLALNTTYYVGIYSKTLKLSSDNTIVPADYVYWTTAGTPTVSEVSAKPYDNYMNVSAKGNVSGTLYVVGLTGNAKVPTASQVVAGKDGDNLIAAASSNVSVSANSSSTAKLSGLSTETDYRIYTVLRDSAGNLSTVGTTSGKTTPINLIGLSISGSEGFSFSPTTYDYTNVLVPYGASSVTVTANAGIIIGNIEVNGSANPSVISLENGTTNIKVTVQESGKTQRQYNISLKKKGTADISQIKINDQTYTSGNVLELPAGTASVTLRVKAADENAVIQVGSTTIAQETEVTMPLDTTLSTQSTTLTVTSSDGVTKKTYPLSFKILAATPATP